MLVTGCGRVRGIGRALSVAFARAGADVVATDIATGGTRNENEEGVEEIRLGWTGLASLAAEIEGLGRRILTLEGDVSRAADAERFVKEALARFGGKPPTSPEVWFHEAGEIGLRVDLELTTARAALAQLDRIQPPIYLAVNLSPDTAVSPMFLRLLAETPVDRVVFEISEHARVHDYDALNRSLAEIRALGGRLAIDDAGAGFASLHHILRLSPDIIKLDISLTRGVDGDRARHALASALTSFAAEIGATIVAEGIETREELEALRTLGVTHGQGYYLGRPGPLPVERADRAGRAPRP